MLPEVLEYGMEASVKIVLESSLKSSLKKAPYYSVNTIISEVGAGCRSLPSVTKNILGVRAVPGLLHVGAGAHTAVQPIVGDHGA